MRYLLAIAAAIALLFWKITLSRQFTWLNGGDTVNQVLPWLQMQAREWHRGHFPLLDPFHWAGQSLIGQTQTGAYFPLNWALFLSPFTYGRLQIPILNAYFVLIHILGAWAMYALLRRLGITKPIAAVGAVAFGGGGFMATVEWPQMLNGAICLPIVLLFWLRFLHAPGRFVFAALSGAAAGVSVLSGHHSAPIACLVLIAGATGYMLFERRRTRRRLVHYAAGLVVFGAFFFLLSAAQTLPAMEYWRVSYRFINTKEPVTFDQQIPYLLHRHFSLDAASLPGLIVNGFHRPAPLNPFLGVSLVTLAAIGFASFRRTLHARLFLFLAVFSLLLAMGEDSWLHGVFFARFPMFDKLRNPSMLVLGLHLSLIVLAALGLEAVQRRTVPGPFPQWILRAATAVLAFLLALYSIDPAKAGLQANLAQAALFAAALAGVLLAARRNAAFLAALLVFLETGANTTRGFPDRELGFANFDKLFANDDIADYLQTRRRASPFRITTDDALSPNNFGDWYGLEQVNGYSGVSINMFFEQWRPEIPQLLSARFHIGPTPRLPDQIRRFEGRSGLFVWESPDYAPWTWTAHRFSRVNDGQLAEQYTRGWPALRDHIFALRGNANPAVCNAPDTVQLADLRPEYGRVQVNMACRGLLVYSSAVLPGWHASIDGQPAEILEAYGKLLSVEVPAGAHTVEFRYQPRSVWLGALLSLTGALAAVIWWRLSGRRESEFPNLPPPAAT